MNELMTSSSNVLESDAKFLNSTVEIDTRQLETYLKSIQETLKRHELEVRLSVCLYVCLFVGVVRR